MKATSEDEFRAYLQNDLLVTDGSRAAANFCHNDIEEEMWLKVGKSERKFQHNHSREFTKSKYMPKSCDSLVLILSVPFSVTS